jgi:hypothetical protein
MGGFFTRTVSCVSDFGDFVGFEAAGANLDGKRGAFDQRLDADNVSLELTESPNPNVLTRTALLLRLTFAGDVVPGGGAFSANITSSGHKKTPSKNSRQETYHNAGDRSRGDLSLSEPTAMP